MVDNVHIEFPEPQLSLGLRVSAKYSRIKGPTLLKMIYDQETRELALDMAMIALEALHRADITSNPFALFGTVYRLVRKRKVILSEMLGPPILSPQQRITFNWLMSEYTKKGDKEREVLVHGDLHASNLVVNLAGKSLGIIDLELLHIGKPAINFAQLWIGFQLADPLLGQRFYERYARQFPEMVNDQFDADVRAEVALKCYFMIRDGQRTGNMRMEEGARLLLGSILGNESFERVCLGGRTG